MAHPPDTQQKAQLRSKWLKQLQRLVEYAKRDYKSFLHLQQLYWYHPDLFNGDLFDIEGMHPPYLRKEHEDDWEATVKDPESPGTVGDLIVTQNQGDFLSALERSYRARHHTWPRMMMHQTCRRYGHQHDLGLFQLGMKDYLQFVLKHDVGDQPAAPPSGTPPDDPWGGILT